MAPNEAEWGKLWRGQEPVDGQVEWRYRAMCGFRLGACAKPAAKQPKEDAEAPRTRCEMCEAVVGDLAFLLRVQKKAAGPGETKARLWAAFEAVCSKVHWRHAPK